MNGSVSNTKNVYTIFRLGLHSTKTAIQFTETYTTFLRNKNVCYPNKVLV
uniref:Uncharacterized protein n=1 Tax=Anguilla anguilla TaxID=7936 RepID=A0A0E9P5I7_ANGAN